MGIRLRIGSPVGGDDFYGRKMELAKADCLIEHNNLMLAAPRRVGKTSFAKRLMEIQAQKGWNTIFVDLEEITNMDGFFAAIYEALLKLPEVDVSEKIGAKIKKWFSGLELSVPTAVLSAKLSLAESTRVRVDGLASILNSLAHHTIIVFDELTVLLESLSTQQDDKAAKSFLNQFRALRMATSDNCSWLVCSSIGVRNFTAQHNLSDTINDIADFELGAFTDEEAISFVRLLADALWLDMSDDLQQYLLAKIGWNIPYFIQLLLSKLPQGCISQEKIDQAYETLLLTGSFDTWNERLNKEYGVNEKAAKIILSYLCTSQEGKGRENILNYLQAIIPDFESDRLGILLRSLVTDGYLAKADGRYRFHSPLLRDYWKNTFCD